jgi:hypothetical protein
MGTAFVRGLWKGDWSGSCPTSACNGDDAPEHTRRHPQRKDHAMPDQSEVIRSVFVTRLRNAHAVEHQALALMDRQSEHLANYPEVEARLRSHRVETEQQIVRLDEILDGLGESHSAVKDAALGCRAIWPRLATPSRPTRS